MRVVLVVDDHTFVAEAVAEMTRDVGCHAVAVNDGHDALQFIRSTPPDLVILDINMPGMTGLDVLEALHEDGHYAGPPVVAYSVNASARERALQLGAVAFIEKHDAEGLVKVIQNHCLPTEPTRLDRSLYAQVQPSHRTLN